MKNQLRGLVVSATSLLVLGVAQPGTAKQGGDPMPRPTPGEPVCYATLCGRKAVTVSDPENGQNRDLEKATCAYCPGSMKAISGGATIRWSFSAGTDGTPYRGLVESNFDNPENPKGWCGFARQFNVSDNDLENSWSLDVSVMCVPDSALPPIVK